MKSKQDDDRIYDCMRKLKLFGEDTVVSAVSIVAFTYFVSYFLSFIKQRFLIGIFGVDLNASSESALLSTFFLADKIPSLIFNATVAGSLSAVLIPAFTKKSQKEGNAKAWEMVSGLLNVSFVFFFLCCLIVIVFAEKFSYVLAFGADFSPVLPSLLRIMMSSQIALLISAFVTSSLQSLRKFFIPSLSPILYNLSIIAFTALFYKRLGIYAPAWGMVFGATVHLLVQIPLFIKLGFSYYPVFSLNAETRKLIRRAIPRSFAIMVDQISLLLDNSLAYLIAPSFTAILTLTSALQKFPSLLVGSSLAQVLLPKFSSFSADDRESFISLVKSACLKVLFLVIPLSVILLVLRIPIIRLVYGASKFSWDSTIASSYTLAFFSLSIFSQSINYILARAFYASEDTKNPLKAGLGAFFLSAFLSIVFVVVLKLGVWSLAFSYSLGSLLNTALLIYFFHKKIGIFLDEGFLESFAKISWSAFFMGLCLYIPLKMLDTFLFNTSYTASLLALTAIVFIAGVFSYVGIAKVLRISEINFFKRLFANFLKKVSFIRLPEN